MAGRKLGRFLNKFLVLVALMLSQSMCIPPDTSANFVGPYGQHNRYRAAIGDSIQLTIWNYTGDLMFSSYVMRVIVQVAPKPQDCVVELDTRRVSVLFNDRVMNLYAVEHGKGDKELSVTADMTFGITCDQACVDTLRSTMYDSYAEIKFVLDSSISVNGSLIALDTIYAKDRIGFDN